MKLDASKVTTMLDVASRQYIESMEDTLALLMIDDPIMSDLPIFPANNGKYHISTKAVKLGEGVFIKPNEGYTLTNSKTEVTKTELAMMGAYSYVEENVLRAQKKGAMKFRMSEDALNAEGVLRSWSKALLYNTENEQDGFISLSRRRCKVDNMFTFSAGGTGTNLTSIWLLSKGKNGVCLRVLDGTGGLEITDKNEVHKEIDGKMQWGFATKYDINGAIDVYDDRALMRIANVDTTKPFPAEQIIKIKNKMSKFGSKVMYVPESVYTQMEIYFLNKDNIHYTKKEIEGQGEVLHFCGIPVKRWDVILETETQVPNK